MGKSHKQNTKGGNNKYRNNNDSTAVTHDKQFSEDASNTSNGRSNGRYKKGQHNDRRNTKSYSRNSVNDIGWYAKNPELLQAAAMLPFVQRPGMTETFTSAVYKSPSGYVENPNDKLNHPGVMSLRFTPTVGWAETAIDPINIAMREIYARVRSKFSGNLSVDPPEIMMYLLALDSLHMYIAHFKRVYRAICSYSANNYDYPDLVMRGLGISPTDQETFRKRKVELWGIINTMVHAVNKYCAPYDMSLYERHRWMCEHVYSDSPSIVGQTYIFRPVSLYILQDTDTMTKLGKAAVPTTFDGIKTMWDSMYSALANWSDSYTINGYIQRAYEGVTFYQAALLMENELLVPQYQPEVLVQIENCRIAETLRSDTTHVEQDPLLNILVSKPSLQVDAPVADIPVRVNLYSQNPTPAEITIATRLTFATGRAGPAGEAYVAITTCGTEIFNGMSIFYREDGAVFGGSVPQVTIVEGGTTTEMANVITTARICWWSHHPTMYFMWVVDGTTPHLIPFGTMENTAIVPDNALKDLHRVCAYSEFNCFN